MNYEKRIVAFADILGWKNATNDSSLFDRQKKAIYSIAEHASNFSPPVKQAILQAPGLSQRIVEEHAGIEFSFFSDSFAVSAPPTHGKFIFKILSWASDRLLREHFLIRGGIAIGDLHHRQGVIFGPALVEAVNIENNNAKNPCSLCSNGLVEYLDGTDYKHEVVLEDSPQRWVANIACGGPLAFGDLMEVVKCEIHKSESIMCKWKYMGQILARMYGEKSGA